MILNEKERRILSGVIKEKLDNLTARENELTEELDMLDNNVVLEEIVNSIHRSKVQLQVIGVKLDLDIL